VPTICGPAAIFAPATLAVAFPVLFQGAPPAYRLTLYRVEALKNPRLWRDPATGGKTKK